MKFNLGDKVKAHQGLSEGATAVVVGLQEDGDPILRFDNGAQDHYRADGKNWHVIGVATAERKDAKAPAPVFKVRGHVPQIVLKLGCKEFPIQGFRKRALRVRRLVSIPVFGDAIVSVLDERGVSAAEIDGLLDWLSKELAKV